MKTSEMFTVTQPTGDQFSLEMLLGSLIDQTRKKVKVPQGFPYTSVRLVFLF